MNTRLRSAVRSTPSSDTTESKMDRSRSSSAKPARGAELKRLRKIALIAFIASVAFLLGIAFLVQNDFVQWFPKTLKPEALKGFASRLEFAARYQVLLAAWIFFAIHHVIFIRLSSHALDPTDTSTEHRATASKNVLTNSLEQIFLCVMNQFAFVSFADPISILKFIPPINIMFLVGRIAFFAGYPNYRTFGMTINLMINLSMLGFNLYKFGSFIGLY